MGSVTEEHAGAVTGSRAEPPTTDDNGQKEGSSGETDNPRYSSYLQIGSGSVLCAVGENSFASEAFVPLSRGGWEKYRQFQEEQRQLEEERIERERQLEEERIERERQLKEEEAEQERQLKELKTKMDQYVSAKCAEKVRTLPSGTQLSDEEWLNLESKFEIEAFNLFKEDALQPEYGAQ